MTNGASGNSKGTSAWECNSDVPTDTLVSVTSFSTSGPHHYRAGGHPGSTGFAAPSLGSTNFTWGSVTNGTDGTTSGTNSPPTFAYWSGTTMSALLRWPPISRLPLMRTPRPPGDYRVTANSPASGERAPSSPPGIRGGWKQHRARQRLFFGLHWSRSDLSGGAAGTARCSRTPTPPSMGLASRGASCSDFAVYPTGQAGAAGAAISLPHMTISTLRDAQRGARRSIGPTTREARGTTSPVLS